MNNEFEIGIRPKQFIYLELAQSKGDLAEDNKLAEGGYGRVYKGFLKDSSRHIAVKRVSKIQADTLSEMRCKIKIVVYGFLILVIMYKRDSNFNAKHGDFGLAKLVNHDKGSEKMMLAGTLGYMTTECVVTGKETKESHISFGVVALELNFLLKWCTSQITNGKWCGQQKKLVYG
ncbi:hypothetical protein R6Q59_016093 [Mikania micrantha]